MREWMRKAKTMWILIKFLWKLIAALRYLMGPSLIILFAVILYLFMESVVLKGEFIRFSP